MNYLNGLAAISMSIRLLLYLFLMEGRLIANLRSSEINYDIAIYEYNNLVLNATREVLDSLSTLANFEKQHLEVKNKLNHQTTLSKLTALRMEHQLSSTLNYLTSEANRLLTEDQEIIAFGNTIQAHLTLIKAIGGGYQACQGES